MAKKKKKTNYQVATFWYRTGARIFDILLFSVLSFAFSFLFFINSPFTINDFFHQWNGSMEIQGWRILILMACLYILELVYFVLIPAFCRGQTLFKMVFKIRVVSADQRRNFFWQIFRREILLWMILAWAGIITGIIATCVSEPMQLFAAVFNFSVVTTKQSSLEIEYSYLATFIRTLYAIGGMVPAIIAIYMMTFKKKRAPQDVIGSDYVVFLKEHNPKAWNNFLTRKRIHQEQMNQKTAIFEPFIDYDASKYNVRKQLVLMLKEHVSNDDQPLNNTTFIQPDRQKTNKKSGSWYDEI